jgi:GT2 family glycosyltransferase
MNSPRILAIILNWRQAEMTIECLETLRAMDGPSMDYLLIDNGSGDGSVETFENKVPWAVLLALPENQGFAAANNIGLRKAIDESYDFALLVNNDAFSEEDTLTRLLSESSADIALLSPKILHESAPSRVWFGGGRQHPQLLEMRDRGQNETDGTKWSAARDVDYLLGTFLLVNIKAAGETGLLDERFFFYYEDLDWSLRFREAGFRLRFVGNARVNHRVSTSTGGEDSPLNLYYLARSSVVFFSKHASSGSPLAILIFRFGSGVKTVVSLIVKGRFEAARAYLAGLRDGVRLSQVR